MLNRKSTPDPVSRASDRTEKKLTMINHDSSILVTQEYQLHDVLARGWRTAAFTVRILMRINEEVSDYLEGKTLSNSHKFHINRIRPVQRNDLLVRLVKGLVVLHVGCADHVGLIRAKRERGSYLHDLLSNSAARVVGSDVNEAALDQMR